MKVYLDDERETPEGWERVYHVYQAIEKLATRQVTEISLDHDLGTGEADGYQVLLWIEEQVFTDPTYTPPKWIWIHTANPSAKEKMKLALRRIVQAMKERENAST